MNIHGSAVNILKEDERRISAKPKCTAINFLKLQNHNTFKALIAISPSGAISFVSDLFGGNISDKELTSRCGLLDLLEDEDSVMADKGFNIADLLNARCYIKYSAKVNRFVWAIFRR